MHKGELWQEYKKNGEPLKNVGHTKEEINILHPEIVCGTVHVWLYRDAAEGRELLFQLRSPRVENGNTWDISVGGHINLGETRSAAALREAEEEIGIKINPEDLIYAFSYKIPGPHAIHNVFLYDYTDAPSDFHFSDSEVADLKWVPLKNLDNFLKTGGVKPVLANLDFYWQLLKTHLDYHGNPQLK
jgi:8-oxo-dGTP pyrophosphatase MutT (NUDIX family)